MGRAAAFTRTASHCEEIEKHLTMCRGTPFLSYTAKELALLTVVPDSHFKKKSAVLIFKIQKPEMAVKEWVNARAMKLLPLTTTVKIPTKKMWTSNNSPILHLLKLIRGRMRMHIPCISFNRWGVILYICRHQSVFAWLYSNKTCLYSEIDDQC